MKIKLLHIIFVVAILLVFSCKNQVEYNTASDGILIIDSLSENQVQSLNGQWEFYPNTLLEPTDFKNYSTDTVNLVEVNKVWNKYIIDNKEFGKFGYGTFHLKIVIPKGQYSFKLNRIETAYKFWADDELIATNGIVGIDNASSMPKLQHKVVQFIVKNDTTDITIQVSNFHHRVGGIQHKILISKTSEIFKVQTASLLLIFFIIGCFIIVSLFFIFNYFLTKNSGLAPLYFGLTMIMSIVFTLANGESLLLYEVFPNISWESVKKIDFIGNYGRILFFVLFIKNIFIHEKKLNNIFIKIVVYIFAAFLTLIIFTSPTFFTNTLYPFLFISFVTFLFIAVQLLRLSIKKDIRAAIIFSGLVVIIITVLNDILSNLNIINTSFIANYGLVLFVLANAVVLSLNIASAMNTNIKYTELWGRVNHIRSVFIKLKPYEMGEMLRTIAENIKADQSILFLKNDENYKSEIVCSGDFIKTSYLQNPVKNSVNTQFLENVTSSKKTVIQKQYLLFPIIEDKKIKAVIYFINSKIKKKQDVEILEMLHSEMSTFLDNYIFYYELENINRNLEAIIKNRTEIIIGQKEKLIIKSISLDSKIEELNISNEIIDDMNQELIEQSGKISNNILILENKKEEILNQKENITNKNRRIEASISYSELIQKTFLESNQKIPHSKYFVYNKSKNMVGGDIWFSKTISNNIIIAVIDSSGTDVISSFLTVLINSLFEDLVFEKSDVIINSPNLFVKELKNNFFNIIDKNSNIDDNFDIFCGTINLDTGVLKYCSTNVIAHVIRGRDVIELQTEKRPYIERKNTNYILNSIHLKLDDKLYLQTDGFVNQIRKIDATKFGINRMNDFMKKLGESHFNNHQKLIQNEYEKWKQNIKQVDDYLVVGFLFSKME